GGVYLRIPTVPFSTPKFRFRTAGGTKVVLPPDPPRSVHAAALDGGAVIRFSPPHFDGGSRLTGFVVRCRAQAIAHTATASSAVAVELDGLPNGATATCDVRARNSHRPGLWSYTVQTTP